MGAVTSPPPADDPVADAALQERPDQRFIGDRDLTAWPSAAGRALAGLAMRLHRRQRRKRARIATLSCACVFALAMGLSRIYLGYHWLTDVLVAWALGLGWLTVVITAHRLLLTLRRRDAASQPPDPVEPAPDT